MNIEELKEVIRTLAGDAKWAQEQEGGAIHDSCEGHAVCDLVSGALLASKSLEGAA